MAARRQFSYRVFEEGGRTTVALAGELDLVGAPEIGAAAGPLVDAAHDVAVDLSRTTFIDSAGLRVLTDLCRRAPRPETVRIAGADVDPLRRLIEVCGLERTLSRHFIDAAELAPGADARFLAAIATDNDGVVTRWNLDAQALYGWSADEALGQPIMDLTVSEPDAGLAQEIMDGVARRGRWEGRFNVRRREGGPLAAQVRLALITDTRGLPAGLLGLSAVDPEATDGSSLARERLQPASA